MVRARLARARARTRASPHSASHMVASDSCRAGAEDDPMDAEEEAALTPGEEKDADVSAITDADIENNPFPRVQPAVPNKKGAAR